MVVLKLFILQSKTINEEPETSLHKVFISDLPTIKLEMNSMMHFSEYEQNAKKSALYPKNEVDGVIYTAIGLSNESGEVLGKLKKIIRDFDGTFSEGVHQNKDLLKFFCLGAPFGRPGAPKCQNF